MSLVLPPHSRNVPIAAFCVEQGRWSKRGFEDARQFTSTAAAVPSREAKLTISLTQSAPDFRGGAYLSARQHRVWDEVARVQRALSNQLEVSVSSPESRTSLQLTLENEKLRKAQDSYIAALKPAGEKETDIIGHAFAVNGKLNGADIYPSNGLFRKMWAKLLTANITEAIAAKDSPAATAPSSAAVGVFLKDADGGAARKQALTESVELEVRSADQVLYLETRRTDGTWVHRDYVAK